MLKPTDGFDIIVNGVNRTFRDREDMAIAAARQLAGRKGNDPVQVRTRATGKVVTVTAGGVVTPHESRRDGLPNASSPPNRD
jgi:hypothetical protein